jgi:osmoprotectant transport system permease protein
MFHSVVLSGALSTLPHRDVRLFSAARSESCLQKNDWVCWEYVRTRSGLIQHALWQHITLTALALFLATLLAIPLAILALQSRWLRASILSVLGIIYTIPSLSLFVLLQPAFGVTHATPVVIALVAYAQLLLVRNIIVGLEGVPDDVLESARGMGYGSARLLWTVRLPLALPAIMAGLRVTTVSTIALLTVGGLIGHGGLGNLLIDGFNDNTFKAQIFTSMVLIVALALVADGLLLLVQRWLTPWARAGRAT